MDSSEALLSELSAACSGARAVRADLTAAKEFVAGQYEVIVCMGDTLTHLRSSEEVLTVLGAASAHLASRGLLLLTFRDYAGPPRRSIDRFLLVRGDAERILTCCLEYEIDRVRVTDVVHERLEGQWSLRASEYEKLRLSPAAVASALTARGLSLERYEADGGRVTIAARR